MKKTGEHSWNLFPVHNAILLHQQKIRQPGEPVYSELSYSNPYKEQPVQFIIHLTAGSTEWTNPVIEINNYAKLEIPFAVSRGQILHCDGKHVKLLDENWTLIKETEIKNIPKLNNGTNKILIDGAIAGENEAAVKIEVRTMGAGEQIVSAANK